MAADSSIDKQKNNNEERHRSGLSIMGSLIRLVRPLWGLIVLAVLFGTAGYLCAIFLTVLTGNVLAREQRNTHLLLILLGMAGMRGILHYAEQYCNHYIAFKLLAIIRHDVFAAMRRLCPAKLEARDRGNLIAVITSDIELLEVFYAHTISPILIALVTEGIMVCFLSSFHPLVGTLALVGYFVIGILIPLWNGKRSGDTGMAFRNAFGDFNSFLLDSFRGLSETLQYGCGEDRKKEMTARSAKLGRLQKRLNRMEGTQRAVTDSAILFFSFGMLFLTLFLYHTGKINITAVITCTIAMMGSFGPVVALSGLSNNLNQTLASGERVLSILEERPVVEDITGYDLDYAKVTADNFSGVETESVSFGYGERKILEQIDFRAEPERITGIHGPSGCGKSTLLKLLMRFWDTEQGKIIVSGRNIRRIPTQNLRKVEAYVTQETQLFHDSIAANIAIGKPGATQEEIVEAAKKASIHEFIMSLPKGYDTEVGELGNTLSGGEQQRIGIARAFLHDAPFILLDEPTSNLDSLNEGIILKSLREEKHEKTILIVSHRESTMRVADRVVELEG